jgi:hypothetical protein
VVHARLVAPLLSVNGWLGMRSARHLRAAPSDSGSSALCLRAFMFDPRSVSECLGDLTCRERELVEAVNAGHVLECSQLSTEQLSATGDCKHIIRAELLRELLLTRCGKPLDPRGVRVRGARITGVLDLTHVQAAVGIELGSCSFDHPLLMQDAHLPWLVLNGSCVPALDGDALQVDSSLFLTEGFRVTGHSELGVVRLRGARITGLLDLRGAELSNDAGPALDGSGIQVDGGVFLSEGFRATGHGQDGAVRLTGARITGPLSLRNAELSNESGPALVGYRLQVEGSLYLDKGFRAAGCSERGTVHLRRAHIAGELSMRDAELSNKAGPALTGDWLQVDGGLFLDDGFRASGHSERGSVRLPGAHITGELSISSAELINDAGAALHGDGLHVNGDLLLRRLKAVGHGEPGAVRLRLAHITGGLSLSGAELTNVAGRALQAAWLQVDGGMYLDMDLNERFRATAHDKRGAVRLRGARITGQLSMRGAELSNETGPALNANGLQVDGDLFLTEGFRAAGHGEHGAVRLRGARITGELSLQGAELSNRVGLVLDLEDVETKKIFLPPKIACRHGQTGQSICDAAACRVNLSGFVYTSLDGSHWNQWLHIIARHTSGYRPQPYQQLAAVRRAAGHDTDARTILIAQQRDLRQRGELGGWPINTVHSAWGVLGGYGYRTGRIAVALLIVLLTAAGLGILAGHIPTGSGRYVAMHTAQANDPHTPCSLTEQIGVGIDHGLPLGTTGIRDRCDFDTTSRPGQAIIAATWGLQTLVWALATLVVAGYSGLIRKAT